ncbi:hypothetical protein DUI87_27766 [Hirundo rustica rustica]|uniref:Uncharacterized protein n=1 Tax=Hirundo rustica rustica TaxID=333673 RepID=A0A3M0J413_HIRRU|nr:hypothetical protein DUI87_27766 [Hirundo rustica rustica]
MERSQSRLSLSASFEALAIYFPCMNSFDEEDAEQEREDLGLVIVHVKILQMAEAKRCLTRDLPTQCVQAVDVQFKKVFMGIPKSSLVVQTDVELDMSMLSGERGLADTLQVGQGLQQTMQGIHFAQIIEEENLEAA